MGSDLTLFSADGPQQQAMASRYISRRYGARQTESSARDSSQVRETSRTNYRSMSVSFLSASQYTDSTYSRARCTDSLLQQYGGHTGVGRTRSSYSQDKERGTPAAQNYMALKSSHLPIWTSSWTRYTGRGAQYTSQFLGTDIQRNTRLSTP